MGEDVQGKNAYGDDGEKSLYVLDFYLFIVFFKIHPSFALQL
jgi:hypothetical protein